VKTKLLLPILFVAAIALGLWMRKGKSTGSTALGQPALELTNEILAYGPRPPASEALAKVKDHLAAELKAAGWETTLQEFERDTPIGKVKFSNLRARLPVEGQDTWKRDIEGLICAHIDSKYFKNKKFLGADDAASACAAVVEIGKYLTENKPEQANQIEIVLFDGEEAFAENMTIMDGLYGSRYYANQWRTLDNKPKFGILLDMVGHKDLSIRIPSDSPKHLAELMFEAAKKEGKSSRFGTAPGSIMDDHLPLNLVGIPTIDIIGDFANKPWWHTPGDNAAIISAESLDISIRVTLRMLDEFLGN
jgi:hypothetical protein